MAGFNLDTSGFSFGNNVGGSDLNFSPDRWDGAFSSATDIDGSSTWLGDTWNNSLGFLSDGLNVYKDYLSVTGKGAYAVPANGSPDQFSEKNQPQNPNPTNGGGQGQVIQGVDNGILLLAGAALAVVLFTS